MSHPNSVSENSAFHSTTSPSTYEQRAQSSGLTSGVESGLGSSSSNTGLGSVSSAGLGGGAPTTTGSNNLSSSEQGIQQQTSTGASSFEKANTSDLDRSSSTNPDGTYASSGPAADRFGSFQSEDRDTVDKATGNSTSRTESHGATGTKTSNAGGLGADSNTKSSHVDSTSNNNSTSTSSTDDNENTTGGDSKSGKLLEKIGNAVHSQKLAEKGEAKREKAAGVQ